MQSNDIDFLVKFNILKLVIFLLQFKEIYYPFMEQN